VIFGDFRRGYVLTDRIGPIRITRDELTHPGYSRYYLRRRTGGTPRNNDALKVLKTL
jgi:HK97 family phage major capsid protein